MEEEVRERFDEVKSDLRENRQKMDKNFEKLFDKHDEAMKEISEQSKILGKHEIRIGSLEESEKFKRRSIWALVLAMITLAISAVLDWLRK